MPLGRALEPGSPAGRRRRVQQPAEPTWTAAPERDATSTARGTTGDAAGGAAHGRPSHADRPAARNRRQSRAGVATSGGGTHGHRRTRPGVVPPWRGAWAARPTAGSCDRGPSGTAVWIGGSHSYHDTHPTSRDAGPARERRPRCRVPRPGARRARCRGRSVRRASRALRSADRAPAIPALPARRARTCRRGQHDRRSRSREPGTARETPGAAPRAGGRVDPPRRRSRGGRRRRGSPRARRATARRVSAGGRGETRCAQPASPVDAADAVLRRRRVASGDHAAVAPPVRPAPGMGARGNRPADRGAARRQRRPPADGWGGAEDHGGTGRDRRGPEADAPAAWCRGRAGRRRGVRRRRGRRGRVAAGRSRTRPRRAGCPRSRSGRRNARRSAGRS